MARKNLLLYHLNLHKIQHSVNFSHIYNNLQRSYSTNQPLYILNATLNKIGTRLNEKIFEVGKEVQLFWHASYFVQLAIYYNLKDKIAWEEYAQVVSCQAKVLLLLLHYLVPNLLHPTKMRTLNLYSRLSRTTGPQGLNLTNLTSIITRFLDTLNFHHRNFIQASRQLKFLMKIIDFLHTLNLVPIVLLIKLRNLLHGFVTLVRLTNNIRKLRNMFLFLLNLPQRVQEQVLQASLFIPWRKHSTSSTHPTYTEYDLVDKATEVFLQPSDEEEHESSLEDSFEESLEELLLHYHAQYKNKILSHSDELKHVGLELL